MGALVTLNKPQLLRIAPKMAKVRTMLSIYCKEMIQTTEVKLGLENSVFLAELMVIGNAIL